VNPSEVTKCVEYLACFIEETCEPTASCATSPDGKCGVNTIGGGHTPATAAATVYGEACDD
jgi:hypothetical protein